MLLRDTVWALRSLPARGWGAQHLNQNCVQSSTSSAAAPAPQRLTLARPGTRIFPADVAPCVAVNSQCSWRRCVQDPQSPSQTATADFYSEKRPVIDGFPAPFLKTAALAPAQASPCPVRPASGQKEPPSQSRGQAGKQEGWRIPRWERP